jgi:hypothetical protein
LGEIYLDVVMDICICNTAIRTSVFLTQVDVSKQLEIVLLELLTGIFCLEWLLGDLLIK